MGEFLGCVGIESVRGGVEDPQGGIMLDQDANRCQSLFERAGLSLG